MKNFLRLTLIALCALISKTTFADTYTYTFEKKTFSETGQTLSLNGVDWTLTTDGGYFGYDQNSTDKGQQIGSSNNPATTAILSTSGIEGTITSIKVNTSGGNGINATLDVTVGGQTFGDQYTLTKEKTDVEFTGSASGEIKLIYTNKAKAIYIKSIEVNYTSSSTVNVAAPKFSLEGGIYTEAQTLTLTADENCKIYYTDNGDTPTDQSTAYTAPITLNKTVTIKAIAYDAAGNASNVTSETYTFPVQCENIAAVKEQANGTLVALTLTDAQVVYVNSYQSGEYTNTEYFIRDASGALDFYNTGLELKANNIMNGVVIGELSIYNGLPELVKSDATNDENLEITEGTEAQPIEITNIADLQTEKYLCDLIKIKGATITSEQSGNYTNIYAVDENESKVMLYDKFKLDVNIPTDNEKYDITGIMGAAKLSGNITNEVFLISIEKYIPSGINDITVEEFDENAPVYNLSGQRVNKDAKGILIQNGKKFIRK